ncbi:MAG: ATP synthase F1 subunit delta [Candidatus Gracilibacteria bacterium]|jgi:F-type H+-transporting ATPase subunit delta
MKVSTKKYAQALTEALIDDKEQASINEKIKNFLSILRRRKKTKLLRYFMDTFKKVWNEKNNALEITCLMAYGPSDNEIKSLTESLKKTFDKKIILNIKKDENLIGGLRLEFDENIIDGSIKKNLEILKSKLVNS